MNIFKSLYEYFYPIVNPVCDNPISHSFMPNDLLKWDPSLDYNFQFNINNYPLQKRNKINKTKMDIAGLFTSSPDPTLSQQADGFNNFYFDFWQFIDIYCFWGGSAAAGIIVPPAPTLISAAHLNGVKVYGTIFFPPQMYGGKLQWVTDILQQDSNGNFIVADKLIQLTKGYGFEGWFINQETEGCDVNIANKIILFLKYLKNHDLEVMWYDSMNPDGMICYRNQLDKYNIDFFAVSQNIFLNYWWNTDVLLTSQNMAIEINRSKFDIFAGINLCEVGSDVDYCLQQIVSNDQAITSAALFNANWYYDPKSDYTTFNSNQIKFWNSIKPFVSEKLLIIDNFTTNFNTGIGQKFFLKGEQVANDQWCNMSLQNLQPECKISEHVSYYYDIAYDGGNCLQIADNTNAIYTLFKTAIANNVERFMEIKCINDCKFDLIIKFSNDTVQKHSIEEISAEFKSRRFTLEQNNYLITEISLQINTKHKLLLGEFRISTDDLVPMPPTDLSILSKQIFGDNTANVNVTWSIIGNAKYTDIFNAVNGQTRFVGRTIKNIYHIDKLNYDKTIKLLLVNVNVNGQRSEFAEINIPM